MSKRNIFRIVLLAAVLAWFGYGRLHEKSAAVMHQTMPAIAANTRAFMLGRLPFKSCELKQKRSGATTAAYCAPFQVPENPDDATSRKIAARRSASSRSLQMSSLAFMSADGRSPPYPSEAWCDRSPAWTRICPGSTTSSSGPTT